MRPLRGNTWAPTGPDIHQAAAIGGQNAMVQRSTNIMCRPRIFLVLATIGLLSLGGCVAYPVDGGYVDGPAPVYAAPVYVAPPSLYIGGGYRPYYGRPWGHRGGWGHRGWR